MQREVIRRASLRLWLLWLTAKILANLRLAMNIFQEIISSCIFQTVIVITGTIFVVHFFTTEG